MADPMKIRAKMVGDTADVRVLMAHQMETGLRKDAAGNMVPAWHITEVVARLNGEPVLRARWGGAISKNPYMQFSIPGARSGDTITITWVDNRGDTRTDQTIVK